MTIGRHAVIVFLWLWSNMAIAQVTGEFVYPSADDCISNLEAPSPNGGVATIACVGDDDCGDQVEYFCDVPNGAATGSCVYRGIEGGQGGPQARDIPVTIRVVHTEIEAVPDRILPLYIETRYRRGSGEDIDGDGILDGADSDDPDDDPDVFEDTGISGRLNSAGNGVLDTEDTNGDGILQTEDADCDGDIDPDEDLDDDGRLDRGEDRNGNGVLDDGEDQDGDGVLDVTEDLNGDGDFDIDEEDIDGDGHFDDVDEDSDGNGFLTVGEIIDNGVLDRIEDLNGNCRLDTEDRDNDGYLDIPRAVVDGQALGLPLGVGVPEDLNGNGILDAGEDRDGDGQLDVYEADEDGNFAVTPGAVTSFFIISPNANQAALPGDAQYDVRPTDAVFAQGSNEGEGTFLLPGGRVPDGRDIGLFVYFEDNGELVLLDELEVDIDRAPPLLEARDVVDVYSPGGDAMDVVTELTVCQPSGQYLGFETTSGGEVSDVVMNESALGDVDLNGDSVLSKARLHAADAIDGPVDVEELLSDRSFNGCTRKQYYRAEDTCGNIAQFEYTTNAPIADSDPAIQVDLIGYKCGIDDCDLSAGVQSRIALENSSQQLRTNTTNDEANPVLVARPVFFYDLNAGAGCAAQTRAQICFVKADGSVATNTCEFLFQGAVFEGITLDEDLDNDGRRDLVNEDANGNGVLDEGEDADGDGRLDVIEEDLDQDGLLDGYDEDRDDDGNLDVAEDLNGNNLLDPGEDIDGDGRLDLVAEDRNGDGVLNVDDGHDIGTFAALVSAADCSGRESNEARIDFKIPERPQASAEVSPDVVTEGDEIVVTNNTELPAVYSRIKAYYWDIDGDGFFDRFGEDINGNGVLDEGEDRSEDLNGNGVLDPNEDLNGNGELDDVPNGILDTPASISFVAQADDGDAEVQLRLRIDVEEPITNGVIRAYDTFTIQVADVNPICRSSLLLEGGNDQSIIFDEGETIKFDGSASEAGDERADPIRIFEWDFGDGSPVRRGRTVTSPEYDYEEAGSYEVVLTVYDEDSNHECDPIIVNIGDVSPVIQDLRVVDAGSLKEGDDVRFIGLATPGDTADPLSMYYWNFDCGAEPSGANPPPRHPHIGDDTCPPNTSALECLCPGGLTTAECAVNRGAECAGPNLTQPDYAYDDVGSGDVYIEDQNGNGILDVGEDTNSNGVLDTPYETRRACFWVTDRDSSAWQCADFDVRDLQPRASFQAFSVLGFNNNRPVADFIDDGGVAEQGDTIWFYAGGSRSGGEADKLDPDTSFILTIQSQGGQAVSYTRTPTDLVGGCPQDWNDRYDGACFVQHTFQENGTYTISLRVSDEDSSAEASMTLRIDDWGPIARAARVDTRQLYEGDSVLLSGAALLETPEGATFECTCSECAPAGNPDLPTMEGYVDPIPLPDLLSADAAYIWEFGDGGTTTVGCRTNGVEHVYADDGEFVVRLTVSDEDGSSDDAFVLVPVLNRPPTVDWRVIGDTDRDTGFLRVEVGQEVRFITTEDPNTDTIEGPALVAIYRDVPGDPLSAVTVANREVSPVHWDFGDGNLIDGYGLPLVHAFSTVGPQTVTIELNDFDGSVERGDLGILTATRQIIVTEALPDVVAQDENGAVASGRFAVLEGEQLTFEVTVNGPLGEGGALMPLSSVDIGFCNLSTGASCLEAPPGGAVELIEESNDGSLHRYAFSWTPTFYDAGTYSLQFSALAVGGDPQQPGQGDIVIEVNEAGTPRLVTLGVGADRNLGTVNFYDYTRNANRGDAPNLVQTGQVPIGFGVGDLLIDDEAPRVWAAAPGSNQVAVIEQVPSDTLNGYSYEVVRRVPTGDTPIALAQSSTAVWVANLGNDSITVIEKDTLKPESTAFLEGTAEGLSGISDMVFLERDFVGIDQPCLAVITRGSGHVALINPSFLLNGAVDVMGSIQLGGVLTHVVADESMGDLVVADAKTRRVYRVSVADLLAGVDSTSGVKIDFAARDLLYQDGTVWVATGGNLLRLDGDTITEENIQAVAVGTVTTEALPSGGLAVATRTRIRNYLVEEMTKPVDVSGADAHKIATFVAGQ